MANLPSWARKPKEILFGQKPSDVKLPKDYLEAEQRRAQMRDNLFANYQAGGPTEGELAARDATKLAQQQNLANQAALANTGRGFGAVAARSQAAQNAGIFGQQIAAQGAQTAAQIRAQERMAQQQNLQNLFNEDLQLAMAEEEYRKANAKKGIWGTALGMAGTAIGGMAGGAQGAQAGGQLGYGLGEMQSTLFSNW